MNRNKNIQVSSLNGYFNSRGYPHMERVKTSMTNLAN